MLSNVVASSEELAVLTRVLDSHCAAFGVNSESGRRAVARELIELFGSGVKCEILLGQRLAEVMRGDTPTVAA